MKIKIGRNSKINLAIEARIKIRIRKLNLVKLEGIEIKIGRNAKIKLSKS